jgi:hypothetical protein
MAIYCHFLIMPPFFTAYEGHLSEALVRMCCVNIYIYIFPFMGTPTNDWLAVLGLYNSTVVVSFCQPNIVTEKKTKRQYYRHSKQKGSTRHSCRIGLVHGYGKRDQRGQTPVSQKHQINAAVSIN